MADVFGPHEVGRRDDRPRLVLSTLLAGVGSFLAIALADPDRDRIGLPEWYVLAGVIAGTFTAGVRGAAAVGIGALAGTLAAAVSVPSLAESASFVIFTAIVAGGVSVGAFAIVRAVVTWLQGLGYG